jgi:hypothetical protein
MRPRPPQSQYRRCGKENILSYRELNRCRPVRSPVTIPTELSRLTSQKTELSCALCQYSETSLTVLNLVKRYFRAQLWLIIVELFSHRQHTQLFKSNLYIYYSVFNLKDMKVKDGVINIRITLKNYVLTMEK